MEINNNNTIRNNTFTGIKRNSTSEKVEQFKNVLIPEVHKCLAEVAERRVPENGIFTRLEANFPIPESTYMAALNIFSAAGETKDQRILSIGVHHPNSDKMFTNYLIKGTKKEILDYLKDSRNQKEVIESVFHLEQKAKEYYQ